MSKIEVDQIDPQSGTSLTIGTSGDTVTLPSGVTLSIASGATLTNSGTATGFASIDWQSTVITGATHTASANQGIWIDTTSNACTLTLPGSPSVGDQLIFSDFTRNWATNAVTLSLNGSKFQGNTSPAPIYDSTGETVHIVYSGSTQGWIPINDGSVALETPQSKTVNFLVIAGGASGGRAKGAGGGAGGYRASFNSEASGGGGSSETALSLTPGTTYTITVGAGGSGISSPNLTGNDGVASSISGTDITDITTVGGGGGGGDATPGSGNTGRDGGSGGGGGGNGPNPVAGGSGTSNQGFAGGTGFAGSQAAGGGGGGAAAVGSSVPGNGQAGGTGGAGVASTITGSSVTRAGGGGGVNESGSVADGPGGSGGGGAGNTGGGGAGTANTGSGGGATHNSGSSGAGGSGVVILRLTTSDFSGASTSGSPTETTSGSDTILTYTGSGSITL